MISGHHKKCIPAPSEVEAMMPEKDGNEISIENWSFQGTVLSQPLLVLVHDVGQVLIQDAIHVFDRNEIQLDLTLLGIDFLAHQVLLLGMLAFQLDLLVFQNIILISYIKEAVAVLDVAMPSPLWDMSIDVASKTTSPLQPIGDVTSNKSLKRESNVWINDLAWENE